MKTPAFFLTLFLSFYFSVSAQVDSFQSDIIDYLYVNGTFEEYDVAYEDLFEVIQPQFEAAEVPEEVWKDVKKTKYDKIKDLIASLAYAYRKHFTHEEILEMKAFYETEAGKQMVANPDELTEEQRSEKQEFFSSKVGRKLESKREPLAADISPIYQNWKKNLFVETMKGMLKLGYFPNQ